MKVVIKGGHRTKKNVKKLRPWQTSMIQKCKSGVNINGAAEEEILQEHEHKNLARQKPTNTAESEHNCTTEDGTRESLKIISRRC